MLKKETMSVVFFFPCSFSLKVAFSKQELSRCFGLTVPILPSQKCCPATSVIPSQWSLCLVGSNVVQGNEALYRPDDMMSSLPPNVCGHAPVIEPVDISFKLRTDPGWGIKDSVTSIKSFRTWPKWISHDGIVTWPVPSHGGALKIVRCKSPFFNLVCDGARLSLLLPNKAFVTWNSRSHKPIHLESISWDTDQKNGAPNDWVLGQSNGPFFYFDFLVCDSDFCYSIPLLCTGSTRWKDF